MPERRWSRLIHLHGNRPIPLPSGGSCMVLDGHVFTVPDGVRGFDANLIIPPNAAAAFIQRGYRFCVRYVRRQTVHDFDLTPDEADGLIGAGLGLMVVQHVESETAWTPTAAKGAANGDVAATEAQQIGIPPGGMVWCDLEGVTASEVAPSQDVDAAVERMVPRRNGQ